MRFTRTAIVGTLTALMIPATIMLAETSPPTRPAGPISVELAKKCRDLALKANPKPAGNAPYKRAQRVLRELHRRRRQCAGINSDDALGLDPDRQSRSTKLLSLMNRL
jgi:hypothetical protein